MKKIVSLFSIALLTMSAWAANTYVKVTSVDQLVAGQKYILVNEEYSRAMGDITGSSTNYGSVVDIIMNNGVIDIEGTDVVELIASEGNPDVYGHPTWYFDINGGSRFLIWVSGNSLNTVNMAAGATGSQWLANLTDDGVILKNKADNTRILQYNSGAPRFACYASEQKPAVLYVQGVPEDEGITTLSQANALEDDANFTFNGDAVVTITWKGSVYLRDESGYGQIAGVEETIANGQVLSQGWNATKTSVNGWVKYIDATNLSTSGETNADLAAPIMLTGFPDESMLNAYVFVENVAKPSFFPIRALPLPDGTTISLTGTGNQPTNGNYNVFGIIWKDGNGNLVFEPVAWKDYVAPPTFLRGDVDDDGNVGIADVSALIDYILTGDSTGINLAAADVDEDDNVGIADVSALIDYILMGTW